MCRGALYRSDPDYVSVTCHRCGSTQYFRLTGKLQAVNCANKGCGAPLVPVRSNVQEGERPVVIVSDVATTAGVRFIGGTVVVVPLSAEQKYRGHALAVAAPPTVSNGLLQPSWVLPWQVRVVSTGSLIVRMGDMEAVVLERVDQALRYILGLA